MNSGSILSPVGDNAIYWFRVVLSKQPDNSAAKAGFNRALSLSLKDIEKSISNGNLSKANNDLARLKNFNPPKAEVDKLVSKIKRVEAENVAKRQKEAEAAKRKLEAQTAEINKYKAAQVGKSSLQIINQKLGGFVEALETFDMQALNKISNMSGVTRKKLNQIGENYESATVTVSRLGIQRNQGLARAEVTLENVFDSAGAASSPESSWQKFTLSIRQQSGVWTGIEW